MYDTKMECMTNALENICLCAVSAARAAETSEEFQIICWLISVLIFSLTVRHPSAQTGLPSVV